MRLEKEYFVLAAKARARRHPTTFILRSRGYPSCDDAKITMDRRTLTDHGFGNPLRLVDQDLICTFDSVELPMKDKFRPAVAAEDGATEVGEERETRINWPLVSDDVVCILELRQEEVTIPDLEVPPYSKTTFIRRVLVLRTFQRDPNSLPSPNYTITVLLTEEEYQKCRALPAPAAFRVSFRVKEVSRAAVAASPGQEVEGLPT